MTTGADFSGPILREGGGDNGAVMAGYSRAVMVSNGMTDLYLLVEPDVDFDDRFKAWDTDNQEWLFVNGWQITDIEELDE